MDANVVLAPTTTLAHFSALPVLVRPGDDVLVDAAAHASVQTATQLLQANGIPVRTVPHNDLGAVESILSEHSGPGRVWLLIDGVYSMHGDLAGLAIVQAIAEAHGGRAAYRRSELLGGACFSLGVTGCVVGREVEALRI